MRPNRPLPPVLGIFDDENKPRFAEGISDTALVAGGHCDALGYLIVGVFAVSWLILFAIYRAMGYHKAGSA
jgi:high-affinity nickel permease